ncbi:DUF5677 domain-containing protein [Aquimarina agarivorans]|uniref:DUF5677 domain-containing protein n=1 Tax=Aquimarina agarivorans TaxID=980584 RepID=UPI000248EA20|nr:DUF5677 domain-containing protein [Aquimarina agarivorans]
MTKDILYSNPLEFYDILLRGPLLEIYTARKNTTLNHWQQYSNLLIDKFAIHSSSFFHLSSGIIEHKKSGEKQRMNGYDIFTVNTTIRVLIETYIAFNHIFVEPVTEAEKHLRFLLWKLDGLYQEKKYLIEVTDFEGAAERLEEKNETIQKTILEIENAKFLKEIPNQYHQKLFDPSKNKSNWRFLIVDGKVKILQIIGLVKHCCKTRAFLNTYKHSSIHTHSNFPAVEEFRKIRGKIISENYTDPITRLSIYLTCLFIYDICKIDENANQKLNEMDSGFKNFIEGMSKSIKASE